MKSTTRKLLDQLATVRTWVLAALVALAVASSPLAIQLPAGAQEEEGGGEEEGEEDVVRYECELTAIVIVVAGGEVVGVGSVYTCTRTE